MTNSNPTSTEQPNPPPVEPSKPSITLTDEQTSAVERIKSWLEGPDQEFRLGGYAGTGKTTVIKALRDAIKNRYCTNLAAFTGKAVNVLQRKQLRDAQTLHSLMYNCEPLKGGGFEFYLKDCLVNDPDLIIVDEASMISRDLYEDLVSFQTKLLFVGDPGQLEPVGDNPNLMASPDLVLSKIHRQAEESPIITLANNVRKGGSINLCKRPGLEIVGKHGFTIPMAAQSDQVICAKNKTRQQINEKFRKFLRKATDVILPDDKIIVLRNNQNFAVFNGMILFVDEIVLKTNLFTKVNCHDEIDRKFHNLLVWNEPFQKDIGKEFTIPKFNGQQLVYADWGYCITCHKSQGSEWDSVLIWDEFMPPNIWDIKRWRYTAITRAAKQLTYCL